MVHYRLNFSYKVMDHKEYKIKKKNIFELK